MHCGGGGDRGRKQAFYGGKKKGHPFLSSQIYTIMFLTIILLH